MKKIISVCILLCVLFLNVFFASAAPELSQEDAEEMLIEAYTRFRVIQNGRTERSRYGYLKDDYMKLNSRLQSRTIFDKKSDGSEYNDPKLPKKLDYVPIVDERFNTLEKCYAYLEEIYTEHWAELLIKNNYLASTDTDTIESIRLSNGGKLYENQYNGQDNAPFELWEDGVLMILYGNGTTNYGKDLSDIGKLNVSGETATLDVTIMHRRFLKIDDIPDGGVPVIPPYEGQTEGFVLIPYSRTVVFSYTSQGWRISGGTFFEDMLGIDSITNTSDPTFLAIPALTVAALTSLAIPAYVMRRRRREM